MSYQVHWSQALHVEPAGTLDAAKRLVLRIFPEAVFRQGPVAGPDVPSGRERQEAFIWLVGPSGRPVGDKHWHAFVPDTADVRRRSYEHAAACPPRHIDVNA